MEHKSTMVCLLSLVFIVGCKERSMGFSESHEAIIRHIQDNRKDLRVQFRENSVLNLDGIEIGGKYCHEIFIRLTDSTIAIDRLGDAIRFRNTSPGNFNALEKDCNPPPSPGTTPGRGDNYLVSDSIFILKITSREALDSVYFRLEELRRQASLRP